MKFNIAICDDDRDQIEILREIVAGWASSREYLVHTYPFPSAEAFMFEYAENKDFDILLLDIEMKDMNGVELARTLRKEGSPLQIVFVTGYDDYIADGYDVAALHYLMKPIKAEKLADVLDRAAKLLFDGGKHIVLNIHTSLVRLPLDKIVYIEAQQNYIEIHALDNTYRLKQTLSSIEQSLGEGFFRTGPSYIVGLRYVAAISRTEVKLDDGTVIPLARGLFEEINKAFIRFY